MKLQSLNGTWRYRCGCGEWSEREVPFSELAVGHSECERLFDLEYEAPRVELKLEGITYEAKVWLNGSLLGKMLPYSEYVFDVTDIVKQKDNLVRVELEDINAPFGPVAGWENFGGIIRDVYLRYRNRERIEDVFFRSELKDGYRKAVCNFDLKSEGSRGCEYEISILDGDSPIKVVRISAEETRCSFELEDIELWSMASPKLYNMQTKLLKKGEIKDIFSHRIGFREIKCDRHRFLLNGEPIFLRGVCKHEMVGDSGHTVPEELIRRDMEMIKSLGCNFVRLVHYPHAKITLDIADEIGLLVSEEPGLWWSDTSDSAIAEGSIEVLQRTVLRDRNHPSIAFWLCFNECVFTEKFLVDSARACKELDPTRLVSGANCMTDEETLKYYNLCGFDFYTMHPYSQTFDRSQRSAKLLCDKPLVFTEWGGHFVYDNPKLMREFIHGMRHLYEKGSDEGALAGAFLWCFAEVNDFNRERPAVEDGRLLEGLVDFERRPRLCYEVFRTAWDENTDFDAYKFDTLAQIPQKSVPFSYVSGGTDYEKLRETLYVVPKPDFLTEQRPRRIKHGPVCEAVPYDAMSKVPCVLCDGDVISYRLDSVCDGVVIIGGVSAVLGYPLGGEYGECAATFTLNFASGGQRVYLLRNGIEITTVYSTYRSSRINPRASLAPRFMEFSYDGSFERYLVNKIHLSFDKSERVVSAELKSVSDKYALLTYAILGYKN